LVDSQEADGPVTIRVAGLNGALRSLKNSTGSEFSGNGSVLRIEAKVAIDLSEARRWVPPTISLHAGKRLAREAVQALFHLMAVKGAKTGLGPLVTALPSLRRVVGNRWPEPAAPSDRSADPLMNKAARPLSALARGWRDGDEERMVGAGLKLLGLGPGLTPSGDDFLAGFLAVCTWIEREKRLAQLPCRGLAESVALEAPARTTRLSARLLAHAANGLLYEPAMSLGASLFAGQNAEVERAALRLFNIGHTSGTDMAAGMLIGAAFDP
jgi:hypothetical protein